MQLPDTRTHTRAAKVTTIVIESRIHCMFKLRFSPTKNMTSPKAKVQPTVCRTCRKTGEHDETGAGKDKRRSPRKPPLTPPPRSSALAHVLTVLRVFLTENSSPALRLLSSTTVELQSLPRKGQRPKAMRAPPKPGARGRALSSPHGRERPHSRERLLETPGSLVVDASFARAFHHMVCQAARG